MRADRHALPDLPWYNNLRTDAVFAHRLRHPFDAVRIRARSDVTGSPAFRLTESKEKKCSRERQRIPAKAIECHLTRLRLSGKVKLKRVYQASLIPSTIMQEADCFCTVPAKSSEPARRPSVLLLPLLFRAILLLPVPREQKHDAVCQILPQIALP